MKKRKAQKIKIILVCFILIISNQIWDVQKTSKNQMIIFNKNRTTLIGLKEGNTLKIFDDDTLKNYQKEYPIKDYRVSENIKNYSEQELPKIWSYNQKKILLIDSLGVYFESKPIEIILLIENPKVNLNRLIDSLQPNQIVTNGSNYPYLKNRWRITCNRRKISFYDISKKGAFIID